MSKRIAILINDVYLECDGDIHWASVIERRIYEDVKRENLLCEPIDYELQWQEIRPKCKDKAWNPLKLAFDRLDKYDGYHPVVVYISNKIIEILTKENENADLRKCKGSGSDQRKTFARNIQDDTCDRVGLDERKGVTLRTVR